MDKNIINTILNLLTTISLHAQKRSFKIDCDFPGGNIVVDSIINDHVFLHQNLNETVGNWFYWSFRVRGAEGRKLTFEFTHPWGKAVPSLNVIGLRGPGISTDGGNTWNWVGMDQVSGRSFKHQFTKGQKDVRFSFAMPYTSIHLSNFLQQYKGHPNLSIGNLAITSGGRSVERLFIGSIHGKPKYRIVITARHHACEMMSNYVLEGLIKFILEDNNEGKWLRDNVEVMIVPFMDKDGVEDGDQGKMRVGRDHNRDYSGESIYASTRALRSFLPVWSGGKLIAGIDLHCPYIRGAVHERIHQVGQHADSAWMQQVKFSSFLEKITRDSFPYFSKNDLKPGESWNVPSNYTAGKNFASWVAEMKEVKLATTIEIPYAVLSGKTVDQQSLRGFGEDLSKALFYYFESIKE